MKYSVEEVINYLRTIGDIVSSASSWRADPEVFKRIKNEDFTLLCRDVILSFHEELKLNADEFGVNLERLTKTPDFKLPSSYLAAIGVLAGSPEIPEQKQALEYLGGFMDFPGHISAIEPAREGFRAKTKASGHGIKVFREDVLFGPFDKATQGASLVTGHEIFQILDTWYIFDNLEPISQFLEKLEKTRHQMPDWDKNAEFFADRFSAAADNGIGRKNPSIAKILRLTKDGADLVSVGECVEATKAVFDGLTRPDRSDSQDFLKNLDILDDHTSFYSVAFQSEFLELTGRRAFMDEGFRSWDVPERENFGRNLAALCERLEGKVADPKILLSGFLLGTSLTESMILKDRSQGDPKWLENAILDRNRYPKSLQDPTSSPTMVLHALLSGTEEGELKAFWEKRPELPLVRDRLAQGKNFRDDDLSPSL